MSTPPRNDAPANPPHEPTRLESVEQIREVMKARRALTKEEEGAAPFVFRPLRRPPLGLLCIMDDGRDDGEWVRLRRERTVIGRSDGDVVIPHDTVMSGRHAEITRELEQGRHRWHLTDLQSTNGTFVRVGAALLRHNQEMLIGGRIYRFDAAPQGAALAEQVSAGDPGAQKTRGWQTVSPTDVLPSLVELTPERKEGQRHYLTRDDHWLGSRQDQCQILLANDPLVSPQHLRIHRDPRGRWHVEGSKSVNGTWLRIERMPLETSCQFQLGEQRFLFRILS